MVSVRTTWVAAMLRRASVLVALAAIAAGVPPAWAQGDEAAHILTLNGRVSVERSSELWALMPGQTVASGQVVVTGPDGYAQLELADHSTIEVFPNSRLVFHPSRFNWKDLVEIYLGKIRLQIQHLTKDDSPYHVTSPTAVISIRGTVLDVEVDSSDGTTIQVETGTVSVRHRLLPGKEVLVETGQTLRVVPNVPIAALKPTSPLVVVGRVARVAADTVARVSTPTGRSGGNGGATPKAGGGSGSGSGSASSGGTNGTNQPAPPSGQDGGGTNAPPGDVVH